MHCEYAYIICCIVQGLFAVITNKMISLKDGKTQAKFKGAFSKKLFIDSVKETLQFIHISQTTQKIKNSNDLMKILFNCILFNYSALNKSQINFVYQNMCEKS